MRLLLCAACAAGALAQDAPTAGAQGYECDTVSGLCKLQEGGVYDTKRDCLTACAHEAELTFLSDDGSSDGPSPSPAAGPGGGDGDDGEDDDGDCVLPKHDPPTLEECEALQDDDCSDGLVNYLSLYYCQLGYTPPTEAGPSPTWAHASLWKGIALGFLLLWLFVLFMMLGSTADDFFSPALIVLSDKMGLSDRTAGVTLLALGNGAPDLFSVLNTIYTDKVQVGLALGDLSGGGNFVVTVVLAALLALVGDVGLKAEGMFMRDALFYAVSVLIVWGVMLTGEVTIWRAAMFFGLYVLYCVLVIFIGPRVPPCLKSERPSWVKRHATDKHSPLLGSALGGGLGESLLIDAGPDPTAEPATEAALATTPEDGGEAGPVGLSAEEGASLLSAAGLGRLSTVAAENLVVAMETAVMAQGMWMQLTGWQDKSVFEKLIYILEAPFTILRWVTIPPVLYDYDDDVASSEMAEHSSAANAPGASGASQPPPRRRDAESGQQHDDDDDDETELNEELRGSGTERSTSLQRRSVFGEGGGEDAWKHGLERPLASVALTGFLSWVTFYILMAQMDGSWPMIGNDSCTAKAPVEDTPANAFVSSTPSPCPQPAADSDADDVKAAALQAYVQQLKCGDFNVNNSLTEDFDMTAEEICLTAEQGGCDYFDAPISLWSVITLSGLVLVPFVWFVLTKAGQRPHPAFKMLLLCLSFISSMFWMDVVAGEAVEVLTTLGRLWGIDMAVLGLTVLAWGNSIGDLVADLSVARAGSPNMAVTACFAGPLFNMLVGLGVSFFIQTVATGESVVVDGTTGMAAPTIVSLHVSFFGLAAILGASAVAGGVGGFRLRKWWIWPLLIYYCSYMLTEVIITIVQED